MVETVGAREPQNSGSGARSAMRSRAVSVRRSGVAALGAVLRALVRVIWGVVALVDLFLVLDFVFRLIGARDEGFAHAVYSFSATLASPFDGIFANVGRLGGYTLKWSDAVVVVLCTLAGLVVTRMLPLMQTRKRAVA
jgi:hypothetical protein